MRISSEILIRCDANAFSLAEGSIRHDRYGEVVLESPESLARGMFPKGLSRNRRELLISSHTERNASHIGRNGTPRVDRRGRGEMASSLTTP